MYIFYCIYSACAFVGRTDGRTDGRTYRQTDRLADEQTNRPKTLSFSSAELQDHRSILLDTKRGRRKLVSARKWPIHVRVYWKNQSKVLVEPKFASHSWSRWWRWWWWSLWLHNQLLGMSDRSIRNMPFIWEERYVNKFWLKIVLIAASGRLKTWSRVAD